MFYYIALQQHVVVVIIVVINIIKKYLGIVVRLLEGFNNVAFPHDLTSRPGFTADGWV
jgi:hypothetical protein